MSCHLATVITERPYRILQMRLRNETAALAIAAMKRGSGAAGVHSLDDKDDLRSVAHAKYHCKLQQ